MCRFLPSSGRAGFSTVLDALLLPEQSCGVLQQPEPLPEALALQLVEDYFCVSEQNGKCLQSQKELIGQLKWAKFCVLGKY